MKQNIKYVSIGMYKQLEEENKKLKEDLENMRDYCSNLDSENDEQALEIEDLKREIEKLREMSGKLGEMNGKLGEWVNNLEQENKKLKHENSYRAGIVDILPKGKGHIAEETIQDLQERINELVWFEKEYHRLRDRIKKLERVLEHEYNRKIPY